MKIKQAITAEVEVYETKYQHDGFYKIKDDPDLANYSAIFVCGGDGTIHEVVNGLMYREDGLQIPLAFFPNGSGCDNHIGFNITCEQDAIDAIKAAHVITVDVARVLIDHESE